MPKTCCNKPVNEQTKDGVHFVWCTVCGRNGKGATPTDASTGFDNWTPPITAQGFANYVHSRHTELYKRSAPFVRSDVSMFERMIAKNTEYIASLTGGNYDKVWASEEGRESMAKALEESIEMGATLPDMGSVVPYGTIAELIPDVEAYRFACTTGASSPFVWVNIEPVYEHDDVRIGRENGQFALAFHNIPLSRGSLAGVAVYGERRITGKVDGDFFDMKTLDSLARKFSKTYQNSMRDVDDFMKSKAEGKTKKDSDDREYMEKPMKGKNGKPDWTLKLYLDEIDCPYTSPGTAAKMYCKLAGKSFLGPYMKVRNSSAAIKEVQDADTVSAIIERTAESYAPQPEPPTTVAELAETASGEPAPQPVKKEAVKSSSSASGLF